MAAAPSASKPDSMRAAVVYQAVHLGAPFKDALRDNGVDVVYESTADHLDAQRIRSEGVQVFLVNLDPDLEEYLDQVTDVLDSFDRPVIFNDGHSSANLSGWDQARWARHLAAKIRGELNAHPPRPANAQAIPMPPARPSIAAAPVVPKAAPAPAPPPKAPPVPVSLPSPDPFGDLDTLLGVLGGTPEPAPTASRATPPPVDLDSLFDTLSAAPKKQGSPAVSADLDALLGALDAPSAKPAVSAPGLETLSFEDIDFSAPTGAGGNAAELTDLDALFQQLESQTPSTAPATPAAPAPAPIPAPAKPVAPAVKKDAPSHWSLAPLEDAAPASTAPAPAGRAQFKIDDPLSKPAAPPAPKAAPKPAAASDAELPALDFDLGDFMADLPPIPSAKAAPTPTPPATAPRPAPTPPAAPTPPIAAPRPAAAPAAAPAATVTRTDNFPDLGLSADEFEALGFDTITAPSAAGAVDPDPLADLDDIFAELDAPSAASSRTAPAGSSRGGSIHLPDLNRVIVLGASIGGPEAVRSFLAGMKPGIGTGFVLAQHMGAEFIELMAAQLDKAAPLRVRVPIEGERFRHSEVIVVPVGKRLTLSSEAKVVMGAPPADSPYSPSIDQVLMDMADHFGPRCTAIIFSGMASDAVEGCKYLHARGGQVWVQDPNTCVISSMIDGAQAAGIVSFVGSPEALAQKVLKEVL
ncbi:MAG: chemotaxis protein CheB [Xanthomonadales bacterium]|jgi:two-component system chemotaxis response regulator CheB/chemosensory pili system protein ChpB (putative protein-glutamate methylesterase)|nr:chemotaxis protein CheB [Xanthomonadales bacterium]